MDQLTQNQNKSRPAVLPKTREPGFLDRYFHSYMKAHRMPSRVTRRFRGKIREERARDLAEVPNRVFDWFANELLTEYTATNKMPLSDEAIEWLSSFLIKLIEDDKYYSIPPDAVPKVCKFANDITANFLAKRPPISLTTFYSIIWYAMLVLGADGREFAFSGEAFAKALTGILGQTIQSPRVYRIRDCFLAAGLIIQCKQGHRNGNCGTYKLKDEYINCWEELGSDPLNGSTPITANEIMDMFPWIFQCHD